MKNLKHSVGYIVRFNLLIKEIVFFYISSIINDDNNNNNNNNNNKLGLLLVCLH